MQEQITPPKIPVRAQKKHIVVFVISCMILVVSILGLILALSSLQSSMPALPQSPDSSDAALPGAEILGVFVFMLAHVIATAIIVLFCAFAWGLGMILSARLAFDKYDKPRWLWIGSEILTAIFTTLVIASLGFVAYVVLMLFVF